MRNCRRNAKALLNLDFRRKASFLWVVLLALSCSADLSRADVDHINSRRPSWLFEGWACSATPFDREAKCARHQREYFFAAFNISPSPGQCVPRARSHLATAWPQVFSRLFEFDYERQAVIQTFQKHRNKVSEISIFQCCPLDMAGRCANRQVNESSAASCLCVAYLRFDGGAPAFEGYLQTPAL